MHDYRKGTVQPKPIRPAPYTAEAAGYQRLDGQTIPRRNIRTKEQLKTRPQDDIATVFDVVKWSSARYGNAKAMGSRKLIKLHNETKTMKRIVDGKEQEYEKQWTFSEMSGYQYTSFTEHHQRALQLGAGLRKLGLSPGDKVEIYASTRYECESFTNCVLYLCFHILHASLRVAQFADTLIMSSLLPETYVI